MINRSFSKSLKKFFSIKQKKLPTQMIDLLNGERFEIIKTHKNNTGLIYLSNKNIFRKFSIDQNGIEKIKNEMKGTKWYSKKSKNLPKIFKKFYFKSNFAYLDLKKINGKKIKSWNSVTNNYPYLVKAYNHYKTVFGKRKKTYIHGDLTLDNIFFLKHKTIFFDWEFFGASKKYYGYDLAYLFLSSICLPIAAGKNISQEDKLKFKNLWRLLVLEKVNKKITKDPFNFFIKSIKSDNVLKKSFKISKKKFFPFLIPAKKKKIIIKLIEEIFNTNI